MDDQQQPDHATTTRPKPAGRIEVPAERYWDSQVYPRQVRTDPIPIDMPRSQILMAIADAVAKGVPEAGFLRVDEPALAVFAERLCTSADDDSRLRAAVWSFVQRMADGIGILRHTERREAIHRRMCEVFGDIPDRAGRTALPTADEIADRDRLILCLRGSACALPSTAIQILTECRITPVAAAAIRGLSDAERELAERIDEDPQVSDVMRRSWAKDISRAVAARDHGIRQARWSMEHRIEVAQSGTPANFAWQALHRHAEEASKRDGHLGTPEDRLRVLISWIVAAGGRTVYSESLLHLWRAFPLRRSAVKPLLDIAFAVTRMRPLAERAMRPDIEDLRRDWRAWHSGSRIAIASMIALVGTPDPCRESTFVAPRWLRRLARDDYTADGTVIADHLAHVVEGKGPWRNVVVAEIRGGIPRLLVGGPTRPFVCSDPDDDDDVVDERPSLAIPDAGDDRDDGGPAMARHTVSAEPVRTTVQAPTPASAPIETPAMSAPSSAAEAAAAKSPRREVREAVAIASHLRHEVVGQEQAVRVMATAVAEARAGRKERGIILLAGPSGAGKTHLVSAAARHASMAYYAISAAAMVPTGIRGTTVDDIFLGLMRVAKGNREAAETGIVFLDEMDKLMMPEAEHGPSVLGQLLRIADGEPHTIGDNFDKTTHGMGKGTICPTNRLTIVAAGAWSAQRDAVDSDAVGFAVGGAPRRTAAKAIALEDLAGLPRELRGRVSRYAHLNDHTQQSLTTIAERFGHEYMRSSETWDRVTAEARRALVDHALTRGTGARGLRVAIVHVRDWITWNQHVAAVGPITAEHVRLAIAEADVQAA